MMKCLAMTVCDGRGGPAVVARRDCHCRHRGLTLVELMVASIVMVILAGATGVALQQTVSSRNRSKDRQEAAARVYAVAQLVARDVANLVRDQELAASMVRVEDGDLAGTSYDRDELLLFVRSQRAVRAGLVVEGGAAQEGGVYEVQYRLVAEDGDVGTVWRRRDPVPDEYFDGGGVAVPVATGITSLSFEVFDGQSWLEDWESDEDGVPFAVRVTCRGVVGETLATTFAQVVVGLDRVPKPVWMDEDDPNFNLFGDDEGGGGDLFGEGGFGEGG